MRKLAVSLFAAGSLLCVATLAAFSFSPWPKALLIRHAYDAGSKEAAAAMEKQVHVPVAGIMGEAYGALEDERLDVYFPSDTPAGSVLPTVVWIHGGGWLAGDKAYVAPYLKLLAAHGFAVVGVNYSKAPAATYPTQIRQAFAALSLLTRQAGRLHVDPQRIVLAGDSAGAQIAAEAAAMLSDAAYAEKVGVVPTIAREQVKGAVLFCGVYDLRLFNLGGPSGKMTRGYLWAYSGDKDFLNDPAFATMSVARYVSPGFPPAFISAGNADALGVQSVEFADRLKAEGVLVDALFFPADHKPALDHEYQFNLQLAESGEALNRAVAFVKRTTGAN
jgi:acetyl esterase